MKRAKSDPIVLSKIGKAPISEINDRYVAICDVLGFSKLISDTPLSRVNYRYHELLSEFWDMAHGLIGKWEPGHTVFSDTILLWSATPKEHDHYVFAFFFTLTSFMRTALLHGLPLRVGVAFGGTVIDPRKGIYIGRPIVEAYITEQRQDWMGGAFHPSCFRAPKSERLRVRRLSDMECMDAVAVRYPVPVNKKNLPGPALNWAIDWPGFMIGFPILERSITKTLRQSRHTPYAQKWQNTMHYFEHRKAVWKRFWETPRSKDWWEGYLATILADRDDN